MFDYRKRAGKSTHSSYLSVYATMVMWMFSVWVTHPFWLAVVLGTLSYLAVGVLLDRLIYRDGPRLASLKTILFWALRAIYVGLLVLDRPGPHGMFGYEFARCYPDRACNRTAITRR